jgi:hypothetical protein
MKKILKIAVLMLIVCSLGFSCASKKKASCPAYGNKSNKYERLPY